MSSNLLLPKKRYVEVAVDSVTDGGKTCVYYVDPSPAWLTTATHGWTPTGIVPQLPVELLYTIVLQSDRHQLPTLALVSRVFCSAAQRLLFKDVPLVTLPRLIRLLRILASCPSLASFVRTLVIRTTSTLGLLDGFYILLSRALHHTSNLKELEIHIGGSHPKYLHGCAFRLKDLIIEAEWNAYTSNWVEEQSELECFSFIGPHSEYKAMRRDALPKLRRVSGPPMMLVTLVPGRPVERVQVNLAHPIFFNSGVLGNLSRALAFSTSLVSDLCVLIRNTSGITTTLDTWEIIDALNVIPEAIPNLQAFSLITGSCFINRGILTGIGGFVERLPHLKRIDVKSKNKHDSLHDVVITRQLAEEWHKRCKTLKTVGLPGDLWILHRHLGWISAQARSEEILKQVKRLQDRLDATLRVEVSGSNAVATFVEHNHDAE